ncbi:MAG: lipopolysaccharide biosynthesis protein [Muribaculaceae bacterium]|nr:lipopolysaccharide biosynthesis protein [Muribaculaceae bacterium]
MAEGFKANNHRIARNTMMLYLRMILMTLIGLYTSRVILQVLGVSDYGVYNAVAGVVSMFAILSSSLSTAVSRYLTFELGRGNRDRLQAVFSTSLNVQFTIAAVVVIVAGLVGWWFLNNKMSIPDGRMSAANWVLACSIMTFAIGLISVPYNASIISHEKMGVFAYMSILEAVLKLAIVLALYWSPVDKLKTYAVLLLCVAIIIRYIYILYCRRHFSECRYRFVHDVPLIKEMTKFAGWNFFGNGAWILNTHGVNILINIFFGVTLNAARGIATQVESIVMQFVNNFMTALNPQITKSYAAGDLNNMHLLVCRGAKFSFFLMMFFAIPCCLETEKLLSLWLGIIPDYAVIFVRLTFLASMCTVLGNTLVTAQLATGKIKRYQIVITLCGVWVFPLTWLAFELGGDPTWTYIIFCAIYFILIFVRIYLVKDLIHLPWTKYVKEVVLRCMLVCVLAIIPPLVAYLLMPPSLLRFMVVCLLSFVSSGIVIYWLGMLPDERTSTNRLVKRYIYKR